MSEKLTKPLLEFNAFSIFINVVLCTLVYFLDGVTTADKTKSVFVLAMLVAVPLAAIVFVVVSNYFKSMSHYEMLFVGVLFIVVMSWLIVANRMTNDINTLMIGYFYLIGAFGTNLGFLM